MAAGLVALVTTQPALNVHLGTQRSYFGVSPPKVSPEAYDHAEAFCKLAVEGGGFICKIAAGSCVDLGLGTISGGSAIGVAVQALSTGKLSAHININAGLEVRQAVSVVDRVLGMFAFLDRGLGFFGVGGFGPSNLALRLLGLAPGRSCATR